MVPGGSIDVDLRELDRFSGSVRSVTSSVLAPGADWLFSVYGAGATFGGRFTASLEVLAARLKYHDALVSVTASLAGFVNASHTLVAAVDQVRARYAHVDVAVAARTAGSAEVDGVLSTATVAAAAQQSVTPASGSDLSSEGVVGSVMGDPADWEPAACVNWGRFTVPQLWDMVKDTDAGEVTFAQAQAWRSTHELLSGHVTAVQDAKEALLAVWRRPVGAHWVSIST